MLAAASRRWRYIVGYSTQLTIQRRVRRISFINITLCRPKTAYNLKPQGRVLKVFSNAAVRKISWSQQQARIVDLITCDQLSRLELYYSNAKKTIKVIEDFTKVTKKMMKRLQITPFIPGEISFILFTIARETKRKISLRFLFAAYAADIMLKSLPSTQQKWELQYSVSAFHDFMFYGIVRTNFVQRLIS